MRLYIVVVMDTDHGPYVWCDNECAGEAGCSAIEAAHETGFTAIMRHVDVPLNLD